jgi:hypothetical protein
MAIQQQQQQQQQQLQYRQQLALFAQTNPEQSAPSLHLSLNLLAFIFDVLIVA